MIALIHSPSAEEILGQSQHESAKRIFDEITEILKQNGEISRATRDRLMLAGMRELFKLVEPIHEHGERLKELERRSVINWIEAHPTAFVAIVVALFVLINLWFVSDFRKAILPLLGFSPDLVP